jgi:hypothetical protein
MTGRQNLPTRPRAISSPVRYPRNPAALAERDIRPIPQPRLPGCVRWQLTMQHMAHNLRLANAGTPIVTVSETSYAGRMRSCVGKVALPTRAFANSIYDCHQVNDFLQDCALQWRLIPSGGRAHASAIPPTALCSAIERMR